MTDKNLLSILDKLKKNESNFSSEINFCSFTFEVIWEGFSKVEVNRFIDLGGKFNSYYLLVFFSYTCYLKFFI